MGRPITELWSAWTQGDFKPENDRQLKLLELWTAFLDKDRLTPDCFEAAELIEKLWRIA